MHQFLNETLFHLIFSHLSFLPRHKALAQRPHGKLHGVPQLVAEMPVAQDPVHVQVDVPS